jgi:hypothetical protein
MERLMTRPQQNSFFPSFSLMEQLMTLIGAINFVYETFDDITWKKPLLNWELHQRSLSALEVTPAMRSSVAAIATNLYSLYEFSVMYILLHVFMGS